MTQRSVTTWRGGMVREVGGRFKREGTYVYLMPIHVDVWQKPSQYCNDPLIKKRCGGIDQALTLPPSMLLP